MRIYKTALLIIGLLVGSSATAQDSIHVEFMGSLYDGYIGNARNLKIIDNHAYLATDMGVAILDISDPTAPRKVGLYRGFTPEDVAVSGDYAYFAFGIYSVGILDISDPTEPEFLEYWAPLPLPRRLEVFGNLGYFLGWSNLYMMDISDPASPETLSTYGGSLEDCFDMVIDGDFAYISTDRSGLIIVNIADPTDPNEVGSVDLPREGYGVAVAGDFAYVATYDAGLRVVNVANRTEPVEVGAVELPGNCYDVAVEGDYACVATKRAGVRVVNVTDPTNPVEVGSIETPNSCNGIKIMDNIAYFSIWNAGFRVIDIFEPENPEEIGAYNPIGHFTSVAMSGQNAFVLSRKDGLRVVDVTDVESPQEIGSCETLIEGEDIQIAGNYAYVLSDERVFVTDVSDPTTPVVVDTTGYGEDFDIEGDYLYTVSNNRLLVIDITDPTESVVVGRFEGEFMSAQIVVSGNVVVINDHEVGLRLIDVSNPAEPVLVGQVAIRDNFPNGDMALSEDYLFITQDNYLGVRDISNPANPRLIGSCEIARYSKNIKVSGDYLLLTGGGSGIQIVDISEPTHPRVIGVNLTKHFVNDLAIGARGEICLLDITSLGIYLAPEVTAVPADEVPLTPSKFSLSAFPNPFNSSVTISFSAGGQASLPVRLAIYDISGRLVADLVTGKNAYPPGQHKVVWDAGSVGAGVYFVRLENNGVKLSRKLLLIK